MEEMQLGLLDRNERYAANYFGGPCIQLIRRTIVVEHQLAFPEAIHQSEDALFNMQMLEYVKSVDFLHETLTTYRVWGMSSFQRFHADLPQQMEQVNQQFLTFGKVHHKGDFYWNAYEVWLMETYIRLLKRYFYHPNNPQSEAEKKRAWKALLTTCPSLKQLRRASWKRMYQSRKSYPLLLFFLLYCRCYALNRRVMEWLLRTERY